YSFGSICPTCDVVLVSASLLGQVEAMPATPPTRWGQIFFDMSVVGMITLVTAAAWFYYLWGGWWAG
ncbi:MAG: hypothetical protein AAFV53_43665, partial [Myxococcota bacterium]